MRRRALGTAVALAAAMVWSPRTSLAQSTEVAVPEIARLAETFAGDWNTVEIVQHGQPVPEGQGRRGTFHVGLANGGTALVSEGHSAGVVGGDLKWFTAIWWDSAATHYGILTCFRAPPDAGCELRGSAHWAGETFVNDYEEVVAGRRVRMRDVWSDITPTSHTLTELHDRGDGVMTPYVVSHNTRRSP